MFNTKIICSAVPSFGFMSSKGTLNNISVPKGGAENCGSGDAMMSVRLVQVANL